MDSRGLTAIEKLKRGLAKARQRLLQSMQGILRLGRRIDAELLNELEESLIGMDLGVAATERVISDISARYRAGQLREAEDIRAFLKDEFKKSLGNSGAPLNVAPEPPTVIMVVGVNGVGKTTSIAKLSRHLGSGGRKVLLAASDTFRAAAVEQLEIWGRRAGVELVKHRMGADPAAVAYDALDAAVARGSHFLIVDTAGRLHTSDALMRELAKIKRVIGARLPGAPHEVLLVLDATVGQNAISQAQRFRDGVGVTGIFLAKLDSTAKGGIVVGMQDQVNIPVKFVGIGEGLDDIEVFDRDRFVDALFD